MSDLNKISIRVGEFDFEVEGSQIEVDEKFAQFKEEGIWNIMSDALQDARDNIADSGSSNTKDGFSSERGAKFKTLVENCGLDSKPDQLLGALHFLIDIEGIKDCPPRVVNELFEQANIDSPGNLSLYINRLKEKDFIMIEKKYGDKNRFAKLTDAGRKHLQNNSKI